MRLIDADALLKALNDYGLSYRADINGMIMSAPTITIEPKWIPVSERLPRVGQGVLFSDGNWTAEGYMMRNGDWIQFRWSAHHRKEEVVAWQPLPKPYGEESESWVMKF